MNLANSRFNFHYRRQNQAQSVRSLSLLSFLSFASLGFAAPFINIYLKEGGMSATFIGVLISLGALLELTLNPVVNSWADRKQRHLWVLRLQMVLVSLATLIFAVTTTPFLLAVAFLLNAVNGRGVNEMLSQLTMTRLEDFKLRIFGKVRMWGSVGWAVATLLVSPIVAVGGYTLAFFAATLTRLLILPISSALPQSTDDARPDGFVAPINKAIYILMFSQFVFFIGLNAFGSFVWIHFREGLHILPEHIGFLAACYAISELVPMRYIDRIIDRFGVRSIVIVGMFGMSIEWVLYGIIPDASWIIVLAFVRALFFTMFVIGMTVMISDLSDKRRVATNRALILVTMPALAVLLTSPLMGWVYDVYGAQALFALSSVTGLLASAFMLSQYHRLRPDDASALATTAPLAE